MKYGLQINVSNQLMNDPVSLTVFLKRVNRDFRLRYLQKSIKLIATELRISDQHADNFVKDISTICIKFNGYKISRIIKKHLYAKL